MEADEEPRAQDFGLAFDLARNSLGVVRSGFLKLVERRCAMLIDVECLCWLCDRPITKSHIPCPWDRKSDGARIWSHHTCYHKSVVLEIKYHYTLQQIKEMLTECRMVWTGGD